MKMLVPGDQGTEKEIVSNETNHRGRGREKGGLWEVNRSDEYIPRKKRKLKRDRLLGYFHNRGKIIASKKPNKTNEKDSTGNYLVNLQKHQRIN